MLKTAVSLCVFAVLATSIPADAQTTDHRTLFTVNQPFSLPGVTLPAGTYQFRVADETTGRRVINVLDATGTKSYALLPSIPAARREAPVNPVVQVRETPEGTTVAIQAWWHPGASTGYEFVYPRRQQTMQAAAVARHASASAPATH